MSYGFLTENDVFYSYRVLCQGRLIASGDGTMAFSGRHNTASSISDIVKDGVRKSVVKDIPSLAGKDLVVEIISMNRI